MKNHLNNKNLITQKSDKGNLVVVFDRSIDNKKMESMQRDQKKIIEVDVMTYSNLSINQKKRLDRFVKSLKEKQTDRFLKSKRKKLSAAKCHPLRPKGAWPRNVYGLNKIYKKLVDAFPPLGPIVPALKTSI